MAVPQTGRRFQDRVVIVTGGASGIGLACCQRFSAEGARVVVADLNGDGARAVSAGLSHAPAGSPDPAVPMALGVACDVGHEPDVQACVRQALDAWGRLDVIVNNAGRMIFKPLEQHTEKDLMDVLRVDLLGAFFFTKQAFLHLGAGGAIVNVSSIHAVETTPLVSAYAAAKAAILSLTRSAAIEGKSRGLRVNAVLPGAIDTPMLMQNPNIKAGIERLDRADVGQPDDVAAAIAWLASDDARFVQGASLRVDGGRLDRL